MEQIDKHKIIASNHKHYCVSIWCKKQTKLRNYVENLNKTIKPNWSFWLFTNQYKHQLQNTHSFHLSIEYSPISHIY